MREIKFRGVKEDGVWAYGHYAKKPIQCDVIIDSMGFEYDVAQSTVGQFTGLTDRNGEEIYEGDIVRPIQINGTITDGRVIFFRGAFHVQPIGAEGMTECPDFIKPENVEVIGNIHETNSPGGSE